MCRKKIAVRISSLLMVFVFSTFIEAEEKKFSLGLGAAVCKWPSETFKYLKIEPEASFRKIYRGLSVLEEEVEMKTLYNLSLQYNVSSRLGIQGEIGHQKANYGIKLSLTPKDSASRPLYQSHRLTWNVTTIFINLIYRIQESKQKLIPYALVGLGFCSVRGEEDSRKDYTVKIHHTVDLGLKAGGGLVYNLAKIPLGFGLRAFIQVIGAELFGYQSPSGEGFFEAGGFNIIWGIDLGLRYRF